MPTTGNKGRLVLATALVLILGTGAVVFLLWLTPYGIGLYYDSMTYLESAQTFSVGQGMGQIRGGDFLPLVHYPPFYSLVLATMSALRIDMLAGARYTSAIALGVVCVLAGATVWRSTRSWLLVVLGACWVLVSSPVLHVFSWAMSEPLYLALWLGSTLALDNYLEGGNRRVLIASAALAGMAFLTRYVGGVPVLAASLVLAARSPRRPIAWKDVVTYLALACAPVIAWLGRNSLVAGNPTNRILALHLPGRDVIRQGADTVIGWFGPAQSLESEEAVAAAGAGIVLVFIILLATLARKRDEHPIKSPLLGLHVLTSMLYVIGVLISITFFDSHTPLDDRIMIPTYLSLGIAVLLSLHHAWSLRARVATALAVVAFLALGVRQVALLGEVADGLRADGQGYAAARWRESETGHRLQELAPPLIYTNDTTAVFFVAGLPSTSIPTRGGEEDLILMRRELATDGAVLAIFGSLSNEFMPLEQLSEGLTPVEDLLDGRIYRLQE